MKILKVLAVVFLTVSMLVAYQSCKTLTQITNSLTNLKRCQFMLQNVNGFRLAGVDLSNKRSISDFSISDAFKLTSAFATKQLPAQFVLNVAAKNPNDGKGGSPQTNATLTGLDWRLLIDDVQTVSGEIDHNIEIPGTGQTSIIPLTVNLDLYQFFGQQGYDKILNLALALGGVNSSPTRLKLDVHPTVSTPMGAISYPGRITVVDKEYK
ncbi:MAG: hypothetical protein ABSG15_14695 [FCB group bacterium]|jgi:hypothetical protein